MESLAPEVISGTISSIIFATGTLTMLVKMFRTHDVDSYSVSQLILNNIGNILYWIYIMSLPVGPIYFLHGFYTIASIVMLICWFIWHTCIEPSSNARKTITCEMGAV